MSVNYHAAQSRGVLFENHEKVSEQWRQEFSQYDPARIKNTLHLETDEEYLYLQYFSSLYRLCLKNGVLEKKSDETWSDQLYFNEAMAIYHFLYYTKDIPVISGSWVPSQTVDGVVSRRPYGRSASGSFCPEIFRKTGRTPNGLRTGRRHEAGHWRCGL